MESTAHLLAIIAIAISTLYRNQCQAADSGLPNTALQVYYVPTLRELKQNKFERPDTKPSYTSKKSHPVMNRRRRKTRRRKRRKHRKVKRQLVHKPTVERSTIRILKSYHNVGLADRTGNRYQKIAVNARAS